MSAPYVRDSELTDSPELQLLEQAALARTGRWETVYFPMVFMNLNRSLSVESNSVAFVATVVL